MRSTTAKKLVAVVGAVVAAGVTFGSPAAASAQTGDQRESPSIHTSSAAAEQSQTKICRAQGMAVWITFHQTSTGSTRTADIDYKVDNNGRNKGNISAYDNNGVYHRSFYSGDNVHQDGKWHHFTRYYRHPYDKVRVDYTFDQAGPDGACYLDFHM